jgi:hypothetical protein
LKLIGHLVSSRLPAMRRPMMLFDEVARGKLGIEPYRSRRPCRLGIELNERHIERVRHLDTE